MKLTLISHGLKTYQGKAPEGCRAVPIADLYIDCRGVVEKGIPGRGFGGASPAFQAGVLEGSPASITSMHRLIEDSLLTVTVRRENSQSDPDRPYVICFLCAWGVHRSVACKHILADRLTKGGRQVEVK